MLDGRGARALASVAMLAALTGCELTSTDARAPRAAEASTYASPDDPPPQLGGWYPISAAGMEPTLHCAARKECGRRFNRNRVQTVELTAPPQRFDIVFAAPRNLDARCFEMPLRVIGLPLEIWAERRGRVYIDGELLDEPFIRPGRRDTQNLSLGDIPPKGTLRRIPRGHYLLMGDNRANACDSRTWGLIDASEGVRKVTLIADYTGVPTGRPPEGFETGRHDAPLRPDRFLSR